MFFYLSKIIWFFLQPSSVLLFLAFIGILLVGTERQHLGRKLALAAISMLIIFGFSPLGNILIQPLEDRFQRTLIKDGMKIDGIVILGGSVETAVSRNRSSIATNQANERLIEGAKLARRWPNAKIIFSGGSASILNRESSEAVLAKKMLMDLGIDGDRIMPDNNSSNTIENAQESLILAKPKSGENWLLVTSAFHMPRSMGCFRQVGFTVLPWPVDYRTRGPQDASRFFSAPSAGLRRIDIVTREWIGLLAYRLTGRIPSIYPAP